jgi:hypothetical protein
MDSVTIKSTVDFKSIVDFSSSTLFLSYEEIGQIVLIAERRHNEASETTKDFDVLFSQGLGKHHKRVFMSFHRYKNRGNPCWLAEAEDQGKK